MSIELTTRNMGFEEIYYDNFAEQGIDCDITLPDYCPDIMRIVKCSVSNSITNSNLTGDRATAECVAKIKIIYADEKNNIFCYDQDYPFSKYAELNGNYDNAFICCFAKTDYVNCRAVSKRRVDIHGVVSIRFKVIGNKNISAVSDACGDGIQLKRKGIDIDDVVSVNSKTFEISQVENVGDGNAGIGKVVDCFASPLINECKTIKGKILLKGELYVRVVYCSDSAENETSALCCNIPFNEIVEASSVSDECRIATRMFVTRISAEPKTDSDGEYRYMNINSEAFVQITAYKKQSIRVVTDAYSTDAEIEAEFRPIEFMQITGDYEEKINYKQNLDVSSVNPCKLHSFSISAPECKCVAEKDKATVKGRIPIRFILLDDEGTPVLCEREAEFEFVKPVDDGTSVSFLPQVSVGGCSASLMSDGKIDFKAELLISLLVFKKIKERALVSLEINEGCEKKESKPAIVVYFCAEGESVWDIARRYNTTVEEIMQENNLNADLLENRRMLLIPAK